MIYIQSKIHSQMIYKIQNVIQNSISDNVGTYLKTHMESNIETRFENGMDYFAMWYKLLVDV